MPFIFPFVHCHCQVNSVINQRILTAQRVISPLDNLALSLPEPLLTNNPRGIVLVLLCWKLSPLI